MVNYNFRGMIAVKVSAVCFQKGKLALKDARRLEIES
jgi:hypothetical protein